MNEEIDVEAATCAAVVERAPEAVSSGSKRAIWRVTANRYLSQVKAHLHQMGIGTGMNYAVHMPTEESVTLETERGRIVVNASFLGCDSMLFVEGQKPRQLSLGMPRLMATEVAGA